MMLMARAWPGVRVRRSCCRGRRGRHHKSEPACTDALGGRGQHVIPSKACFTEHSYMTGICQVYKCHNFQLDASEPESASAARRFRACRVSGSQARRYVSDLDFLRIISVLCQKGHQLESWACQSYPPIQILFKIHTLAVIGVQVIALSV